MLYSFELRPAQFTLPDLDQIARDTFFHVGDTRPEFPDWTVWVLPWTLVKDKPGVATVVIDLWSFAGTHLAVGFLARSAGRAGQIYERLLATYAAVALKLGINPAWITALFGAIDIATQRAWFERVKNYVEGQGGPIVFQTTPMWFVDP